MQQPMTCHRRGFLALAALALPTMVQASLLNPFEGIASVQVFCNSAMLIAPVSNAPFRQEVMRMDALEQLSRALTARLPQGGEAVAYKWLMQHQAQFRQSLAPAAAAAANALNLARYYRITHLPAIVINRAAVVYGVTDVAQAIARYQAHRQQKGQRP